MRPLWAILVLTVSAGCAERQPYAPDHYVVVIMAPRGEAHWDERALPAMSSLPAHPEFSIHDAVMGNAHGEVLVFGRPVVDAQGAAIRRWTLHLNPPSSEADRNVLYLKLLDATRLRWFPKVQGGRVVH